mmetsp:Transcript_4438/g.4563  ORF Transcript_4438/g.4563 Transcript_4438/m.4563 type:complete len:162 (-) Transcript_4438:110-595(-)
MESIPYYIIFVCTSNTCRSPMAEGLAIRWLEKNELSHKYKVVSRGLTDEYEPPNSPASSQAVIIMAEDFGIDISNHRSKLLTLNDIQEATHIVGVSRSHSEWVISMYTEYFTNHPGKLTSLDKNVPDPWHSPTDVYRACVNMMEPLILTKMEDIVNQMELK